MGGESRSNSRSPDAKPKLTAAARPVSAVQASEASRLLVWPTLTGSMPGRTCRATVAAQRPARPATAASTATIRATVDIRLVSAMASPVVAAGMPSDSSVLAFTSVPVADPNGVRWLTKKVARVTSAASRNRIRAPSAASTRR
jgi:hypothetical protein